MITDRCVSMEMFDSILIRPNSWHQFITPFNSGCRVLEIQYGWNVMESDIERV